MSEFIPNSFQVPNLVVDEIAKKISPRAFSCLIFIIRKTRGWNKTHDSISVTQFKKFLRTKDDRTVQKAIAELEQNELISVAREVGKINDYSLSDLFESYPQPPAKNEGGQGDSHLQPPTKNVGTKNDTTHKKCSEPPTKNVGSTTHKKCGSTKDNIKTNTNKKENITKEKDHDLDFRGKGARPIDPDFKPEQQDIDILNLRGISTDFIMQQLPEFILYWQEVEYVGRDWRAKFRNRVTTLHLQKQSGGGYDRSVKKTRKSQRPVRDFEGVESDAGAFADE